jgi:hypothetical protein
VKSVFKLLIPLLALWGLALHAPVEAASHREAPLMANDPSADITDVYAFRSWENPDKVVFILNVIPAQEPSAGPNYFNFGDDVLYAINLDVNRNGKAEDVVYEVRFKTEIRGALAGLKLPLSYAAIPPITALDGPGSDGLILRQRYTVTEVRGKKRTDLGTGTMFAVPSNVGPLTMPDYEALAAQGIYHLGNGGRVFAGQRDETFYIDLGATFDTVNLRRSPPLLTAAEDSIDSTNPFGNDALSGFNVSTIAIEVPISSITDNPNAVIGVYASTSRQKFKELNDDGMIESSGPWVQVSRMGNPLVNELIIGTAQKDLWNATEPNKERQFIDFYLNSRLAKALNIRYNLPAAGLGIPETGRTDLVNALLKYSTQPQTGTCSPVSPCSELLRLNLAVAPTPPYLQKRLSILAGDNAGWPNGRRPNDDVTDIALRVVAGRLIVPTPPSGGLLLGDGVNFNIGAPGTNTTANGIYNVFPFLPTPHDGRDRRHIDCNEALANPC